MNRFSKDIGQVDDMLPMSASDTLSIAVQSLVILALSIYTNYYLIIVSGEGLLLCSYLTFSHSAVDCLLLLLTLLLCEDGDAFEAL